MKKVYFKDYLNQIKEDAKNRINKKDYFLNNPRYKWNDTLINDICKKIISKNYNIEIETGREFVNKKCIAYFSNGSIQQSIEDCINTFVNSLLNELQACNNGRKLSEVMEY